MTTLVMEHFNNILFHKIGLANKQHTNQSINKDFLVTENIVKVLKM